MKCNGLSLNDAQWQDRRVVGTLVLRDNDYRFFMSDFPDTPFWRHFRGAFSGLLKWHDMDVLWEFLKASPEGWYVFDMLDQPPTQPIEGAVLPSFLSETEQFLRKRHGQDYCGLIYVDQRDAPEFIKIYDPKNMGTACGGSTNVILPRWTLTRIKPDAVLATEAAPETKYGSFNSLLGRVLDRVLNRVGAD